MSWAYVYAPFTGGVSQRNNGTHWPCTDGYTPPSPLSPIDIGAPAARIIDLFVNYPTVKSVYIYSTTNGSFECCDTSNVNNNLRRAIRVNLYSGWNRTGYIGWALFGHVDITYQYIPIDGNGNLSQKWVGRLGQVPNGYDQTCYAGTHTHMECNSSGSYYDNSWWVTAGSTPIYKWWF